MRRLLFSTVLLTATGLSGVATAQGDSSRAAAVALYDQAEALMKQGQYAAACPKYAESNRLDPQLGALVHLADCYEKNGQLASAWARWRDAADIASRSGDARGDIAKKRAAALQPKLSKLVVQVPADSEVSGLEVKRDGTIVIRSLWGSSIPVDAGKHVIEATAPGKKKLVAEVSVGESAAVATFELPLLEDETTTGSAAPAAPGTEGPTQGTPATASTSGPASMDAGTDPGATQRTLGWISGGLGVLCLGAGVFFEIQRSSKLDDRDAVDCPDGRCSPDNFNRIRAFEDDADQLGLFETLSFAGAGVFVVGGAVLLLTAPSNTPATTSVTLTPMAGPGSYGLGALGRF